MDNYTGTMMEGAVSAPSVTQLSRGRLTEKVKELRRLHEIVAGTLNDVEYELGCLDINDSFHNETTLKQELNRLSVDANELCRQAQSLAMNLEG